MNCYGYIQGECMNKLPGAQNKTLISNTVISHRIIQQNFIPIFQMANLRYFYLPHWASGSQVLLAPPQFLLAPGKRVKLNVEPWSKSLISDTGCPHLYKKIKFQDFPA